MKKLNGGVAICIAMATIFVGCDKFETRDFKIDKPQSLIDQEERDAYKELKTYVDYSSQPNFKLGAELDLADLTNNSLLYRLIKKHVDEISFTRLNHMDYFTDNSGEANTDMVNVFKDALAANQPSGMSVHAGHLLWHDKQRDTYMEGLMADVIIPGQSGSDVLLNFNSDPIGKVYHTSSSLASATVVADPNNVSGNALRILKTPGRAFPQFQVTLPAGKTLGDYKSVALDFKGGGCCGFYGGGMRMHIGTSFTNPEADGTFTNYGGPSSFAGMADNVWGRGLINLPLSNMNLTAQQKLLTTFVLTIGSFTGAPDYLIDNIAFRWEKPGQTIVKSPAEKKEIVSTELDKWIKAIGEAGKDKVNSWSVVYQPLDETDPTKLRTGGPLASQPANAFYWQDYLGRDYAEIAIKKIKQYANSTDKIFFTETNLIDNPAKIQGLRDFIAYTESKGAPVDGVVAELVINADADKAKIETTLQGLAAIGKLVKISADIGTGTTTPLSTQALYQQQADMYNWLVKAYFSNIPVAQRAGIIFRSPLDRANGDAWRSNQPVGLWTNVTSGSTVNMGYQRKPAYVGVVEALQGK